MLETELRESEEKRKKAIFDQHEAEYATKRIKSEHEQLKVENDCLNSLIDLQKLKIESSSQPSSSGHCSPVQKVSTVQVPGTRLEATQETPGQGVQEKPSFSQVPKASTLQAPETSLAATQETPGAGFQEKPSCSQVQKPSTLQADDTSLEAAQETPGQRSHEKSSSQQPILQAYRSYRNALLTSNKLEETILNCDECGYPFKLQEDLNTHIKRHSEVHCTKCNKIFQNKLDLKFHITYESNCERQWNCKDCGYQGNSRMLLKTHIEEKHTLREESNFPCTMCDDVLNSKWYFNNHIRDRHSHAKEPCKHFPEGRCKFEEDECWGSHQETNTSTDKFECHTCRQLFSSKNIMMKHRKANHRTKQCNDFFKGSCRNSDEECWYMHTNQVFHQARLLKNPPLSQ